MHVGHPESMKAFASILSNTETLAIMCPFIVLKFIRWAEMFTVINNNRQGANRCVIMFILILMIIKENKLAL